LQETVLKMQATSTLNQTELGLQEVRKEVTDTSNKNEDRAADILAGKLLQALQSGVGGKKRQQQHYKLPGYVQVKA
jgi:hypothetical protein